MENIVNIIVNVIHYLNDNAFVTSVVTLLLSTLITIIINIRERKHRKEDYKEQIKREELLNKGELRIEKRIKGNYLTQLDLIYSDFSMDGNSFVINKKLKNTNQLDNMVMPISNIGKKAISELYIVVNNRDKLMIVEEERIKYLIKDQYPNYVVPYYDKILPDEGIIINLEFLKDSEIFGSFGSELTIYYRDDYGNFYYQPVFLNAARIEGPYQIKYEDYRSKTSLII